MIVTIAKNMLCLKIESLIIVWTPTISLSIAHSVHLHLNHKLMDTRVYPTTFPQLLQSLIVQKGNITNVLTRSGEMSGTAENKTSTILKWSYKHPQGMYQGTLCDKKRGQLLASAFEMRTG